MKKLKTLINPLWATLYSCADSGSIAAMLLCLSQLTDKISDRLPSSTFSTALTCLDYHWEALLLLRSLWLFMLCKSVKIRHTESCAENLLLLQVYTLQCQQHCCIESVYSNIQWGPDCYACFSTVLFFDNPATEWSERGRVALYALINTLLGCVWLYLEHICCKVLFAIAAAWRKMSHQRLQGSNTAAGNVWGQVHCTLG